MQTELSNEFYPLLAGYYDESDFQAYQAMWVAFRELPVFSRNLLTSNELPLALKALSERFHFDQSTAAFVSVMTRKIIFQEWNEEQSRVELASWCQEFDSKNLLHLEEILTAVKNDILTITPREEENTKEEGKSVTIRTTLLEALSQYPQLGQQTITDTRIKLKASVELVRGSLINWLKCYREELGVGYHDAMLRGQFLFRSQNGIKLTDEEHGRIELLLRSLEDRETVEIDTEHQALLFPPYIGPRNSRPEQPKQPEIFITGAPVVPVVSPVSPPIYEKKAVLPHEVSEKEPLNQTPSETGPLHVLKKSVQFSPVNQTLGTLHFSSRHVLPVEKEIQTVAKEPSSLVEKPNKKGVASPALSESGKDTSPVSLSSGLHMTVPSMKDIPRPTPAPKRAVNLSYIPKPYRIDPTKREQSEKE